MGNITREERARRAAEAMQPAAQAQKPGLVPMVRDPLGPLPHAADVHPDELENYRKGGWRVLSA